MNSEKLENIISSIKDKIGEEQTAIIADDLGILTTENETALKELASINEENQKITKRNQDLVAANSSLLQQVGTLHRPAAETVEEEDPEKPYDYNKLFDGKGNLIRD